MFCSLLSNPQHQQTPNRMVSQAPLVTRKYLIISSSEISHLAPLLRGSCCVQLVCEQLVGPAHWQTKSKIVSVHVSSQKPHGFTDIPKFVGLMWPKQGAETYIKKGKPPFQSFGLSVLLKEEQTICLYRIALKCLNL